LAVFEPAQLLARAERYVTVGADAPSAARFEVGQRGKETVSEIRFGRGTKTRNSAGGGEPPRLVGVHVGRMHEAPGRVDRRVVEEPLHGPGARPGEALLDLESLLGDVNVDACGGVERAQRRGRSGECLWRYGAERVVRQSHADVAVARVTALDLPAE